jgi:hypothetical protein
MITNDVSDYRNLLVRITHIICNHPILYIETLFLRTPRNTWDGNIKTDLTKLEYERVDWTHLYQECVQWRTLVKTVMNLRFPKRQGELLDQLGDY